MENNTTIFWDKSTSKEQIVKILKHEENLRFAEFASLLLSRSNDPRAVFNTYLTKERFARNWAKIKRRMRQNKWSDTRIIFWDEIYKAVIKEPGIKIPRQPKVRPLDIDPEIRNICAKIKDCRLKAGLTQINLAKKTGLSQQSISFVEQGYINMSLRTLKKIADALNLKVSLC